jgi:hypothetical protein
MAAVLTRAPKQIAPDQAVQWTVSNLAEVARFAHGLFRATSSGAEIFHGLQDQWARVQTGQWIVKTGPAQFAVLNGDEFRAGYEIISELPGRWL